MADREGDIYPMFARCPEAVDLVVRATHDRILTGGGTLFAAPAAWTLLGSAQVKVAAKRPGGKDRTASVAIKAGRVKLKRPRGTIDRSDPAALTLGLVEVRETAAPEAAGKPLLWHLLTTLPVATLADAQEVVRLYRLRWRIEQVFRIMKSDGLDIEDSQLETATRLMNLAALALVAAARTIQLVDARDGSARPATDVIAAEEIEAAAAISAALEGATVRQKNPHPAGSLAWLAPASAGAGYGSRPGSAAGIATISRPDPRPWRVGATD